MTTAKFKDHRFDLDKPIQKKGKFAYFKSLCGMVGTIKHTGLQGQAHLTLSKSGSPCISCETISFNKWKKKEKLK